MRLKYHLESETEGVLILESEPQMRNVFVYSQTQSYIRLPFPYIQFVIRYIKKDGKLYYPGVWGSGLRVFGSLKPLSSMTDEVFLLPTDIASGYVCTNHMYDMKRFSSLKLMAKTIISFWWNVTHTIAGPDLDKLKELSLDNLDKFDWKIPQYNKDYKPQFWDALKVGYSHWQAHQTTRNRLKIPSFDTNVPLAGIIIDEPWEYKKFKFKLVEDVPEEPLKKKRGRPKKVKDEIKI